MNHGRAKSTLRRLFLGLALGGLAVYAVVCVGCASAQRRMIYYPPHFTAQEINAQAGAAGFERWLDAGGGAIGIKRMSPRQPSEGCVLITYGNASWSVGCAHYADALQQLAALDVFVLEYPGYADRAGSPSQKTLFEAADAALGSLDTNQPVYLVGESLGSGVACHLAGTHPDRIAGVMLLSPFNRLTSVAQYHLPVFPVGLILVDTYPSQDYLRHYHGPIGVMVDGKDRVIPEKFGLRLYENYAGPKQLWRFADGNHISIMEPPAKFWGEVLDFWRTNQAPKAEQIGLR